MPSFVKTCTWTGTTSTDVQMVTLNSKPCHSMTAPKKARLRPPPRAPVVTAASTGDDSYYLVEGQLVTLEVKKGSAAFKIAVYKTDSGRSKGSYGADPC
jgi:hypothetical protein